MEDSELLRALIERMVKNATSIKPHKVFFHARFEVPKHYSKKNGKIPRIIYPKGGGRPFATLPTRAEIKQAEESVVLQLRSIKNRIRGYQPPPPGMRLWLIVHFYYKNLYIKDKITKERRYSKRVHDQSNLYELPQDCLEKAGIIHNDRMIRNHDLCRTLPGDKNEIELLLIDYSESI